MSDEALRELERAWRGSRDPRDEARLLAERLRAGRVARARLELAAYLGHGPARVALGEAAPAGRRVPWDAWVVALDDAGRVALVQGLVAGVEAEPDLRADAALDHALDALREWLACPCPAHAASLREARDGVRVDPVGPESLAPAALKRAVGAWCLREAIVLVLTTGRDAAEGALRRVVGLTRVPDVTVRPAVVVAPLLAWALGAEHALLPAAGSGRPADYLRSRLLRGELPRERVLLAAYADDEDARAALGAEAPDVPGDLAAWVAGLADFDPALPARAVAALAGHTLYTPVSRAWLGAPTTSRGYTVRAGVVRQAREACDALRRFAEDPGGDGAVATQSERLAGAGIERAAPDERAQAGVVALRAALDCALGGTQVAAALEAVRAALPRDAQDEGLLVARAFVASWALGGTP